MIKRELSQLAIYSVDQELEMLPLKCLRELYLEKTSDIIYIVKGKRLYGIICMEQVLYGQKGNTLVKVNRSFTVLKKRGGVEKYEAIEACKIFKERFRIHKIPLVNDAGELLGDYSRWDDVIYVERNWEQLVQGEILKEVLNLYEGVYIIEPAGGEVPQYMRLKRYMDCFEISYKVLPKEQICEKLEEKAICIFQSDDERRGIQCLYGLVSRPYDSRGYNTFRWDYLAEKKWKLRLATYKSLLCQIMKEKQLARVGIKKPCYLQYDRLDEKATILLRALISRGINCICLSNDAREETEYGENFKKEIEKNKKEGTWRTGIVWEKTPHTEMFYGELLQLEDYEKGNAQREILRSDAYLGRKVNKVGKYYNIVDGRRKTLYQPKEFIGTIYLIGLCVIAGGYVEDQYTIASWLQKKLLEKGYPYRVENYGMEMRKDIENRLDEIGVYDSNDLVIFHSWIGEAVHVPDISLEEIFRINQIPGNWVIDAYPHCNHKANQLVSEALFEMIEPKLLHEREGKCVEKIRINFRQVMKEYVRHQYLDFVFSDFSGKNKKSIGAIVMEGCPFNIGHRYLIEQAKMQVDFLILFVLEEDTFFFPFKDRLKLIEEGTKDIPNIMIVPSGDFILSRYNFPEYYSREWDARAPVNAEYDINVFADYIAGPLGITHRFAGAEPKGKIKKVYYEAMRRILPQKGISFVEIQRMKRDDGIVSTSVIQSYLASKEYDKALNLVPESTKQYLMM